MHRLPVIALLLAIGLSACSSQSVYYSGQAWRRSLCDKVLGQDRARCLSEASKTYGEYQQESAGNNINR
jgi:hypothetical protein